ncbi:MAG: protein-L-isoaspartate(D-aspartate) O-methyltransferase [Bacteroidales bacterium]|nr:protein-L-isoaspartate(D-aspartate) O-methyltransferase [Bacteroidales bacterium]
MNTPAALLFLSVLLLGTNGFSQENSTIDNQHPAFTEREAERESMVENGIENYPYQPVRNPLVLKAMRRVPRHIFVPEAYQREAYRNSPLLIGHNQTISQPFIVAHMTEMLELRPNHRVLEIGTGSGYQAAVLGELCNEVFTMEIIPPLGRQAESLLNELGYTNILVKIGNGYEGWPEFAPFDRIIVTCAPDDIPQALLDQLSNGGRIVIPVGKPYQTQYMVVVEKDMKGRVSRKRKYPVRFVPMTGKASQ